MAAEVVLTSDTGAWIDLRDSDVYGFRMGSSLGFADHKLIFSEAWQHGHQPIVGKTPINRIAEFTALLKGTSLDDLIANFRDLQQVFTDAEEYGESRGVSGAKAYLSVKLDGATYPTVYDVIGGQARWSNTFDFEAQNTTEPRVLDIPVAILCKPFGRPQLLTVDVSGTLNNGGGVSNTNATYSQPAPLGEVPTPAKVTIKLAAGDDGMRFLMGKKSNGNIANFLPILHLEEGTHTSHVVTDIESSGLFTQASAAPAVAANNSLVEQIDVTSPASPVSQHISLRIVINDNLRDFYGRYRVFLRLAQVGDIFTALGFRLTYGGDPATSDLGTVLNPITYLSTPNTDDRLVDLGNMTIPYPDDTRGTVVEQFKMILDYTWVVTGVGDGNDLELDCLILVPNDEGFLDALLPASSGAQAILVFDALEEELACYLTDSAGILQTLRPALTGSRPFMVQPGKINRWVPIILNSALDGHDLTDQMTLEVKYAPRYHQFRNE